jgi:hypothetical protein
MAVATSNTAYGIIADAMRDAGYLREGSEPNSQQLATNFRRLCDIMNFYQTQGCKLFLLQEISIVLVAGTNSYTVNPTAGLVPTKHLRIEQGRIQEPSGTYRPINPISWQEWNNLPQTNEGAITGYLEDRQATSLNVKFWNTPDANEALNTAVLLVRTQAVNPINLELNVSFPQEWRMALRWGLADDIATGQPQAIMDRCQGRAKFYREALEDFDVESAQVTFAPDMRYGWNR